MTWSAIWDKSAQVHFSKTNKIALALGARVICSFWKFTSADLSQIAREKSCDYLLLIHMQKFDLLFSSFTCHRAPFLHSFLFPPTNDNLDQDWSKFWQVNNDG